MRIVWYKLAVDNNKAVIQQNLGENPEIFLQNLIQAFDKIQQGFSFQNTSELREAFQQFKKMEEILAKNPDFFDRLDKIYPGKYTKLRNFNKVFKYLIDMAKQGQIITKEYSVSNLGGGKIIEFFEKSKKILKALNLINLGLKVGVILEKIYKNEEVDTKDKASLVAALIQIPQIAAIAGPYAPALMTAGFIADIGGIDAAEAAGELSSNVKNLKELQFEQKSNQASMGNKQRKMLSETTQELKRLVNTGMSPINANKIVKQKYKKYFDEASLIYKNNKNLTDNLNTASNLTFLPIYIEFLQKLNSEYQKKQPKKITPTQTSSPSTQYNFVSPTSKTNQPVTYPPQYIIN